MSPDIAAGACYPKQDALAAQIAEIDALGRIITNHLDDNQIMWD